MSNNRKSKDMFDELIQHSERFIQDAYNEQAGAQYDWTQARVDEFSSIDVETLLTDDYFLGLKDKIFPGVWEDIIDLWEERKKRPVNLALFLEGIGAGKTMKAAILQWLLWFELSMHLNPQDHFDLMPDSIIAIMNFSRTETQSRRVTFSSTWDMFQSQFNKDYFPVNDKYTREIRIDRNKTCVFPGTSSALSALGYNVYAATIDEANFLEVIEDSKKAQEEIYDAAEEMHNAVHDRMTSRFMKDGQIPGMIIMISSPQYPNSFMERKIDQAKKEGEEVLNVFWRRRSTWESKGAKWFPKFFNEGKHFVVNTETLEVLEIND